MTTGMRALRLAAAAVVLAASVWTGVRGLAADLRVAFRDAPLRVISPQMAAQVAAMKKKMAPGARVIYLGNRKPPDGWQSVLWQRAFSPTRVVVIQKSSQPMRSVFDSFRAVFAARYALSVGSPPEDPGFLWREEFPPLPGTSDVAWFGELKP